jgi:NAD(P)-dependent dehydrogenase (short-subunit alcohol dehydrogenase family)
MSANGDGDPRGTVAYITGASRGIGRLLATALAEDGVHVVGLARPSDDLDALPSRGLPILPIPVDVSDPVSVSGAFSRALATVGPPTLVVTCAGSMDGLGPIATVDVDRWWRAVAVDLRGTMLCVRAAMSLMAEQGTGRIVTVYGNLGDHGREHVSAFAAAKAATARFTETLATELAGTGVRAVCMHPGFVQTPMTEYLASSPEGRAWLPEFGPRARDHWDDGSDAVDLIRRINAGEADSLAGRIVHAGDDLDQLATECERDPDRGRLRLR